MSATSSEATCQRIRLRNGRSLSYATYGDPHGKPVLLAHRTAGSRLERHPDDAIARSLGARLIVPDRPGYGLSTFQRGRTLLEWPEDVVALADALGIERFALLGLGGGGPYALACACRIGLRPMIYGESSRACRRPVSKPSR
jgi:pimeloyl-ACP methyl ester carboxylesterase